MALLLAAHKLGPLPADLVAIKSCYKITHLTPSVLYKTREVFENRIRFLTSGHWEASKTITTGVTLRPSRIRSIPGLVARNDVDARGQLYETR